MLMPEVSGIDVDRAEVRLRTTDRSNVGVDVVGT